MTGWQASPPKIKKNGHWMTGWQASPPKTKKNGHWMNIRVLYILQNADFLFLGKINERSKNCCPEKRLL